jgi:hypothetical protein
MTAMTGTSTLARKLPATTARIVFTLVFCVQPFTGTHRSRSGPPVFQGFNGAVKMPSIAITIISTERCRACPEIRQGRRKKSHADLIVAATSLAAVEPGFQLGGIGESSGCVH